MVSLDSTVGLRRLGFGAFRSIAQLRASGCAEVLSARGLYLVVRTRRDHPRFLHRSPAGTGRGRDPTLPVEELRSRWVAGAQVLYIGKAGGAGLRATVRQRVRAYVRHGAGHAAGHWGGRAVWQLADVSSLLIGWRTVKDPPRVERELLEEFRRHYGQLPFANRRR